MALTKKDISDLLDQKFDEKLEPIKKELETVKKIVNREFINVNTRLDRLEDISLAVVEDFNEHDARLKRLEKDKKVSSSN